MLNVKEAAERTLLARCAEARNELTEIFEDLDEEIRCASADGDSVLRWNVPGLIWHYDDDAERLIKTIQLSLRNRGFRVARPDNGDMLIIDWLP